MKSHPAAWSAFAACALVSSSLVAAKAEEAFEPQSRFRVIEGCTSSGARTACGRFQGYVVVGHGQIGATGVEAFGASPRSAGVTASPDAALGEGRVYLRTGASD